MSMLGKIINWKKQKSERPCGGYPFRLPVFKALLFDKSESLKDKDTKLFLSFDGFPIIEYKGKSFVLTWDDILDLAGNAGLFLSNSAKTQICQRYIAEPVWTLFPRNTLLDNSPLDKERGNELEIKDGE